MSPVRSQSRSLLLALLGAVLLIAPSTPAQTPVSQPSRSTQHSSKPKSTEEQFEDLQKRAFKAIDDGNYAQAAQLLRELITIDPGNFVPYYNLACALSLDDKPESAADALIDAIEHGFVDLDQLRRDPQLVAARRDPRITKLISAWPTVLDRHLEASLRATAALFNDRSATYKTTRDAKLRIAIISAMDPGSTEAASADITRLHQWAILNVFPELADAEAAKRDAWCVVALPTAKDFLKWIIATYGADAVNSFSGIGGSYINDQKRLVAQDLGPTLRHEFFHVLHWRSMSRRGQEHPIWLQEGLCSLVEEYEVGPDNSAESLKPVASWRTNMAKRIMTGGRILPLKELTKLTHEGFTGSSPLAKYAQARTFFLYLFSTGKLKDWYTAYTTDPATGYAADRTGLKSLEAVFAKPSTEIDKDYKIWLKGLPTVAEQIRPGKATISVDVEQGDGDGPVIAGIPPDARGRPNPARTAGLRVNDVITAIDGKPTRDLNELVRLLGEHDAGDTVEVSYRRGKIHGSVKVVLVPR